MQMTRWVLAVALTICGWQVLFTVGAAIAMGLGTAVIAGTAEPDWPFQLLYGLVAAIVTVVTTKGAIIVAPRNSPAVVLVLVLLMGFPAAGAVLRGFFLTPIFGWLLAGAAMFIRHLHAERRRPTHAELPTRDAHN